MQSKMLRFVDRIYKSINGEEGLQSVVAEPRVRRGMDRALARRRRFLRVSVGTLRIGGPGKVGFSGTFTAPFQGAAFD
jgi:hypothetical protein